MNKFRAFAMFMVAILLGISATWYANKWIQQRVTPGTVDSVETTPVVVAALEIPFGQKIEASHLKLINWPSASMPEGVFNETAVIVGKLANIKIVQNELLIQSRVVNETGGNVLAAVISPHMRAITVRVNDVIGVGGFLLPGNIVDIIASRKDGDNNRIVTETILENLKVLAVDQAASSDENKPVVVRAVTLEADPYQSEILVQATQEGEVQLVLRNPDDSSKIVRTNSLAPLPAPEIKTVEVVKYVDRVIKVKPDPVPVPVSKPIPKPVIRKKKPVETVTVIRGTTINKTNVGL